MRRIVSAAACAALACTPSVRIGGGPFASAQDDFLSPRRGTITNVAPGVRHMHVVEREGPWTIDVITVDLRNGGYELRHVRARDSLAGREKLSSMVARQPEGAAAVVAAINADFFNTRTGESENNQVIAGEWWKGLRGSDSPFDAFENVRTHFGVDAAGRPLMDRFVLEGTAMHSSGTFPVLGVNFIARTGNETSVLYTPRYGVTPVDTARPMAEARLKRVAQRGDTIVFVQAWLVAKMGGNPVPPDGAVLAAYGPRSTTVAKFAVGDTVKVVLRAAGNQGDGPAVTPRLLIGGWPRILRNGVNVAARASWSEGTLSSNAEARHPRSAVGFSRDSSTLFLVTVDGRQATSVGMTLVELAVLMKDLGAWDALNFDGGGSSTLAVKGTIVNKPADAAGERDIANALLVVRRQR